MDGVATRKTSTCTATKYRRDQMKTSTARYTTRRSRTTLPRSGRPFKRRSHDVGLNYSTATKKDKKIVKRWETKCMYSLLYNYGLCIDQHVFLYNYVLVCIDQLIFDVCGETMHVSSLFCTITCNLYRSINEYSMCGETIYPSFVQIRTWIDQIILDNTLIICIFQFKNQWRTYYMQKNKRIRKTNSNNKKKKHTTDG